MKNTNIFNLDNVFDTLLDPTQPTYLLDDNVRQIVKHISILDFVTIEHMDNSRPVELSTLADRLGLSVFKGGLFESDNRRLPVIALLANEISTVAIDVDTGRVYNCLNGTSWVGADCLPVSDSDIADLLGEINNETGVYFINAPIIDDFAFWLNRDLAVYNGVVYDAIFEDDYVLVPGQRFVANLATGDCEIITHDLRYHLGVYNHLVDLLRNFCGYMIIVRRLDAADNVILSVGGHVITLGNFDPPYCGCGFQVIDLADLEYDYDY